MMGDRLIDSPQRRSTPGLVSIIHVVLTISVLFFVGCGRKSDAQPEAGTSSSNLDSSNTGYSKVSEASDYRPAALPDRPESPFLNTQPRVQYVGSDTCQNCHGDVHTNFFETRHSQSMSAVGHDAIEATIVRHEQSGLEYQVGMSKDGRLFHSEAVLMNGDPHNAKQIFVDYVVGSGRFGKSYLSKRDGYLVQSPLTWYSERKQWGMSPGYDFAGQFSFKRAVSAECLYCHAGNVDVVDGNKYHMVIHEQFVSCERCHGPGELHVQKHLDESSVSAESTSLPEAGVDHTIVNPSKLNRHLQESICQQCHLQSDASITVRGCDFNDFRPGLPLDRFRQDFRFGKSDDGMTIVGHVEQLHRSLCYQQTDTLTCTTCHQPHTDATTIAPLDAYRNTCLKCHTDNSCGESLQVRTAQAQNHCTECHMPSSPTEVPHVAFTHHRIGIHSSRSQKSASASTAGNAVIPMVVGNRLPDADQARVEGLATLLIFQTKPQAMNNDVLKQARDQLQQAWDGGAGDADVAAGLANIAEVIGFSDMIEKWATSALQLDKQPSEARATALKVISELRFRQGKYAQAYKHLQELTEIRRDSRAWFFRGLAAQNLAKTDDAIASLLKSVDIDPRSQSAHSALAALFGVANDSAKSEFHKQMAEGLAPLPN